MDGDMSSDDYVYQNRLYSEDHLSYEFAECDDGIYYGDGGVLKSAGDIGPKFGPISSTCKIRAYYYDVPSPFGLQAVMYDFTGFLVGDSLLMTAAHGLCLDVTSGIFDDGIENYYMPGKVEVYGAIGLADEWHGGYRYYSECGEIYMDAEYLGNRTINRDWALLRLDRPLGRELSYRVLVPEASAFESLSVVGYPSWNQLCERKGASNGSVLSSYGQFCYSTDTSEGMSGSPLCDTSFMDDQAAQYDSGYGSDGNLCLASRLAYGMHISYDYSNELGFGLRFTSETADLVNALNRRYRPSEIDLLSEVISAGWGAGQSIQLSGDYRANSTLLGCIFDSGRISLAASPDDEREVSFSFNFPVSGISVGASISNYRYSSSLLIRYRDIRTGSYVSANLLGQSGSSFQTPTDRFSLIATDVDVLISELVIFPDWGFIPVGPDSPSYSSGEISVGSDNNCVSYAFRHIISGYTEDYGLGIVPHEEIADGVYRSR
ncbi:MAG: trypsin-like peptidase domain-containing protein, partial [Oscillospiraceae bacterium]|nr:trypsin-like peptidase domain-containing protein [Oscillospiraceae bacterium]